MAHHPALCKNQHSTRDKDQGQIAPFHFVDREREERMPCHLPLEASSVEPMAKDLESLVANWVTSLNYKESEDNRKWSFATEVKKDLCSHISTKIKKGAASPGA